MRAGRKQLRAGALNRQISLFAASSTPDGHGGASPVYIAVGDAWASIVQLSTAPDLAGDRSVRLRRIAATIRRRADLAPGDRVRADGVDYDITSIEDADERGTLLTLVCEESVQ